MQGDKHAIKTNTSVIISVVASLCSSFRQCFLGVLFCGIELASLGECNQQRVNETEMVMPSEAIFELQRVCMVSRRRC